MAYPAKRGTKFGGGRKAKASKEKREGKKGKEKREGKREGKRGQVAFLTRESELGRRIRVDTTCIVQILCIIRQDQYLRKLKGGIRPLFLKTYITN